MGSTRDESKEVKQEEEEEERGPNRRSSKEEEERGPNRRSSKRLRLLEDSRKSCLRRGKRLRYHLEEEEEGHERDEEEEEEEEEEGDVSWFGPGSSSRPRNTQRTPDKKRASSVELDVLPVTCGGKEGTLDVEQLARGEMCIECEGGWFSPPAFENFGGKGYYKKWKQSIYYEDQPLESLFKQGLLTTPGFNKKRNTEDKKVNNCRKMGIGGHTVPVRLHGYHLRVLRKGKERDEVSGEDEDSEGELSPTDDSSEMKEEGEKKWLVLKGYGDIKAVSKQQGTSLKIPLVRLSATKISILSSNSRKDLKSADNWCMPLEDIDDDDDDEEEEPREETEMAKGSSASETCRRALPITLQMSSQADGEPHVSGTDGPFPVFSISNDSNERDGHAVDVSHSIVTADTEYQEKDGPIKTQLCEEQVGEDGPIKTQLCEEQVGEDGPIKTQLCEEQVGEDGPIKTQLCEEQVGEDGPIKTQLCEEQVGEDGPIKTQLCEEQVGEGNIKEEQIERESDGELCHTSGSENNTPIATGKTNDKTVQQQSIQSEPATSTPLSQNHCLPSSVPNARNTKTKAYRGFRRKRPSSLVRKRQRCGQDKAQEKKRDRRDMLMLTTLREICDSQHRMCDALERLCSKQDVVLELLKTLTD